MEHQAARYMDVRRPTKMHSHGTAVAQKTTAVKVPLTSFKMWKTKRWPAFALAATLVVGCTAFWLWGRTTPGLIPPAVQNQVSFVLYQPHWLPDGYTIDAASWSVRSKVVTFSLEKDGQRIHVSEQPRPAAFDFDAFYTQMDGSSPVVTSSGIMSIGRLQNVPLVSLVGKETWVLVHAPSSLPSDELERFVRQFK